MLLCAQVFSPDDLYSNEEIIKLSDIIVKVYKSNDEQYSMCIDIEE